MRILQYLLLILAVFPWLDFAIRMSLPSVIGSLWDELFLLVILGALWFYKRRDEPRYLAVPSPVWRPLAVFALFAAVSVVVNVVPLAVGIDAARVVFQPMLFALLTLYLMDEPETSRRFMNVLLVSTVLIALFGIIQYVFRIDTGLWQHAKDTDNFRIVSIFSNPNALAAYLNMALAFTVASVLLCREWKQRLLCLGAAAVVLAALLLTFSRAAWIAFVLMALYFVYVWNKKWLLAVPVAVGGAFLALPREFVNRFARLLDPAYYQMSAEYGRLDFWGTAWGKVMEYPLWGVGLGMFGDSVPLRHGIPFSTWVDNHYLKLGAETGVIGMAAFMVLLYVLFRTAHRLYLNGATGQDRVWALGIAGVVITMAVENVTASIFEALTVAIYFYAFAGMLLALVLKSGKGGGHRG